MPTPIFAPSSGLHSEGQVPQKVRRRTLVRPPTKHKFCRDDRNYVAVPYTIQGTIAVGRYGPMWRADRTYWIARITANVGLHDDNHPDDGTPSGDSLRVNMHRVKGDLGTDTKILANDALVEIAENHHQDVANDSENGRLQRGDFNVTRLDIGDHVYVEVVRVGSGRPGSQLVTTITLVPLPEPDTISPVT